MRVLAGTGIRVAKWSERRVSRPLSLAPEASASLLGYALKKTPQRTQPDNHFLIDKSESAHFFILNHSNVRFLFKHHKVDLFNC